MKMREMTGTKHRGNEDHIFISFSCYLFTIFVQADSKEKKEKRKTGIGGNKATRKKIHTHRIFVPPWHLS